MYAWRTRKHGGGWFREWAYVGETTSFHHRERQHRGRSDQYTTTEKPWMDLDAKMYRIIRLPWWLCWKWVLKSLETLAIALLWPRYNHAKNLWNPRRIPLSTARRQRAARDAGMGSLSIGPFTFVQAVGLASVVIGVVGWMVTR